MPFVSATFCFPAPFPSASAWTLFVRDLIFLWLPATTVMHAIRTTSNATTSDTNIGWSVSIVGARVGGRDGC